MQKRPTIIDVARLAGVSKATVGRVVNGQTELVSVETRERVMDAIAQLNYERNAIAGSLRTDKTHVVGLCIADITNPFFPELVRGVQDTLEQHDYAVVTANSDWDIAREAKYLKMMRYNRFDGLIISPTHTTADYRSLSVPVVVLGNGKGYPEYDSVGNDSEQGVEDALEYLYALGHRRIGIIIGGSARKASSTRHDCYVAFHAKKQLPLEGELIAHCQFSLRASDSFAAGAEVMKQLLTLAEPPTAVLAGTDILAIAALQAAQELEWRVPQEISIMGMEDILAASMTSPPLTTIAKPLYDNGVQAAELLLARMHGEAPAAPQHFKLPCTLVVRGSTAPPHG